MGDQEPGHDIFNRLVEEKDYFALRERLEQDGHSLPRRDYLCYAAVCASAFNDCERSDGFIDEFFGNYAAGTEDSIKAELIKIRADNSMRLYRYGEAADHYAAILKDYGHTLEEREISEVKNNFNLWNTVRDVPPQKADTGRGMQIPFVRSKFNHLIVDVSTPHASGGFLFDTGANLSTITGSYASKMGMEIMEAGIEVATSTDIRVCTKLAVADSLCVGGLLFGNVVFLVVEDSQLAFDELDYNIDGVIGFPVIHQMREVRISRDAITIPEIPTYKPLYNLCLEGLMPVVKGRSAGRELLFTLDTGANRSELSRRYYDRNEETVQGNGILTKSRRGGGGGMVDGEAYEIEAFPLEVGSQKVTLPKINVSLSRYLFNEDKDGNLGQDVFMRFGQMTICFEYMYVDFGDPVADTTAEPSHGIAEDPGKSEINY